jgi:DNA-binding XRE family transcriptional regulator
MLPLAQLRRRVPWTQGELAAAAGVATGTVRAIEQGAYKTTRPWVMRALATALGVAPAVVTEFRASLGLLPLESPRPAPADLTSSPAVAPTVSAPCP